MLGLHDSRRDDDPDRQRLLRAVEDAPHSRAAMILAAWQVARVLAVGLVKAVLAERARRPTAWPPGSGWGAAIPGPEPPSPMITGSAALAFRKQRCAHTPCLARFAGRVLGSPLAMVARTERQISRPRRSGMWSAAAAPPGQRRAGRWATWPFRRPACRRAPCLPHSAGAPRLCPGAGRGHGAPHLRDMRHPWDTRARAPGAGLPRGPLSGPSRARGRVPRRRGPGPPGDPGATAAGPAPRRLRGWGRRAPQGLVAYRQPLQHDANLQAVQTKLDALSEQSGK